MSASKRRKSAIDKQCRSSKMCGALSRRGPYPPCSQKKKARPIQNKMAPQIGTSDPRGPWRMGSINRLYPELQEAQLEVRKRQR